jgi:hypothetical protein
MMPMVFSATASSMPAFEASHPVSSSIAPRPRTGLSAGSVLAIYLDLPRDELQAITAVADVNRVASVAAMQERATISHLDG